MPIYEYRCGGCAHEFEEMQRITSEPHAACPECGSEDCTRLMSLSSFVLKGSGWYATDYGGKNGSANGNGNGNGHEKKAEPKESKAKASDSKLSESKPSESKPGDRSA